MSEFSGRAMTGAALSLFFYVVFMCASTHIISLVYATILLAILWYEWPRFNAWSMTPFYPITPFLVLIILNEYTSRSLLVWLNVVVGSFDTGSYLIGTYSGHHKIWPSISPGKTWQGLVGGICIACGVSILFVKLSGANASMIVIGGVTLMVCIAAFMGDLFESYLKRRVGLKDSGGLLPGHGGILDRCDGLMAAAVLVLICKTSYLSLFK
jgi:CDP-diglyceride synthetase